MITVNNTDIAMYKNIKIRDIIGFALNNGYYLIDQMSSYLVSFWQDEITCGVQALSDKDIDNDSTLNELITAFNICSIDDIIQVFVDEKDFTINLTW